MAVGLGSCFGSGWSSYSPSADLQIEPEFDTLFSLVHRPDQVARLHRLEAAHKQWQEQAYQEINSFPQDLPTMEQHLLQRKHDMDDLRAQCKAMAADGRFEPYKVSLQFDNPEARLAHGFPIDEEQKEVKEMLAETNNTGQPYPEIKL